MPVRASQAPGVSRYGPTPLLHPGLPSTAEAVKINETSEEVTARRSLRRHVHYT